MKKLLLMLLVSMPVVAADLKFTNNSQTAELIGSATINHINGDITVTTVDDILLVASQPGYVALYADDTYQVQVNDAIDLNWTTGFVSSCTASVTSGSNTGWSGAVASSNGNHTASLVIDVLPKTYNIQCNSIQGGTVSSAVTFTEESVLVGEAPTLTLSASPSNLNAPGNSTLNWTVGGDATTCTASNGWTGSKASGNGPHSQSVTVNSTTTYTLNCSNSFGSVQRNTTVSVNEVVINPECVNFPPPSGTSVQILGGGSETLFTNLSGGNEFGFWDSGTYGNEILKNKYVAIRTTPLTTGVKRKETFVEPLANTNPTIYTVALSKCPGDFSGGTTSGLCVKSGGEFSLNWSSRNDANPNIECVVEQGVTYYLNVIHSQNPPYSTSTCGFSDCGLLFREGAN